MNFLVKIWIDSQGALLMRPVTFYRCNFYGLQFVLALVPFRGSLNFLLNRGWEWVYLCMYGCNVGCLCVQVFVLALVLFCAIIFASWKCAPTFSSKSFVDEIKSEMKFWGGLWMESLGIGIICNFRVPADYKRWIECKLKDVRSLNSLLRVCMFSDCMHWTNVSRD